MKIKENNAAKRSANDKSLQLNFASLDASQGLPDIKDLASRLHFSPVDGRI